MSDEVRHRPNAQRFELEVDGKQAVAEYRIDQDTIILTHTFVPPELRGRGLAEKVVRAALSYAREQNLRVVPQCSYVEAYLRRHRRAASFL